MAGSRTRLILFRCAAIALAVLAAGAAHGQTAAPARVRHVADEVLSRREFAGPGRHGGWLAALWEWLNPVWDWIGGLFERIREWIWGLPTWLSWLVIAWLVLTLLAIVAHLVYVIVTQFSGSGQRQAAHAAALADLHDLGSLDYQSALAAARRARDGCDWPRAIRYLYVGAILWLDDHGLVHYRESKTNEDYVRELAPVAGAQRELRQLTRAFDGVVYGGRPAREEMCQAMSAAFEGLQREAGLVAKK